MVWRRVVTGTGMAGRAARARVGENGILHDLGVPVGRVVSRLGNGSLSAVESYGANRHTYMQDICKISGQQILSQFSQVLVDFCFSKGVRQRGCWCAPRYWLNHRLHQLRHWKLIEAFEAASELVQVHRRCKVNRQPGPRMKGEGEQPKETDSWTIAENYLKK
jgi:hypothetical protein